MSREDARVHVPDINTYAIRIFSKFNLFNLYDAQLIESPFYKVIKQYVFDDIEPGRSFSSKVMPNVLFNENIAQRILNDFQTQRGGIEALLVHCTFGKNRSPAVAIALNEIFNLGHDSDALKKKYDQLNKYVYHVLKETARKMDMISR